MRPPPRGRRAIGLGLLLPGLLLTHGSSAQADSRVATAPSNKAASKTPVHADRKVRSQAGPAPARQPLAQTVHVVRAGDSISRIAARYHVSRKSVIDANKLAHPEQLRVGQRLVVPGVRVGAGERPASLVDAVLDGGDVVLVRAGPRRVPTRFYLAAPDIDAQAQDFAWPVEGRVVSPFGRRHSGWHAGMDIKGEIGTPILAAAPGVVVSSGQERAYGRIIRIEHDNGFVTVYAHNLENLVEVGDRVTTGTIIGTVGRSGRATAPHLHFEVRHEGLVYNPVHLLPAREVIEVPADEAPDRTVDSARAHGMDDDPDE